MPWGLFTIHQVIAEKTDELCDYVVMFFWLIAHITFNATHQYLHIHSLAHVPIVAFVMCVLDFDASIKYTKAEKCLG